MTEATDRNRVRIDGDFTGIKFSARVKDNKVVQTAVLNFELELTDRGREELKKLIDWQTETVGVDILRRQPALDFGQKPKTEEDLPLAVDRSEPEEASSETLAADVPVFVDDLGRHCQVAKDDLRDRWGAFRVKKNGGTIRIKDVPLYAERANAEKGLVAFAKKAGFLTLEAHEGLQREKEASNG